MKTILNISILAALSFLFFSCEKSFLGPDEENTPENNFELFWENFDEHYALFYIRNLNWDSIYNVHRPRINPQTTDAELWEEFGEMIDYLDDSHTRLIDFEKKEIRRSAYLNNEQARKEFSIELVEEKYIENRKIADIEDERAAFLYGNIKDKTIGYIHLRAMIEMKDELLDPVIEEMNAHQAIILDLRNNRGGDGDFAARIANVFADDRHFVYTAQTRNGPEYDDFDEPTEFYTEPANVQFLKPVIVLTNGATISAGEELLLHVLPIEKVTIIGEPSAGDFSDVSTLQFLPNGWTYVYSNQMYLLPDGTSLDGKGVSPDIYFKNTEADIADKNDRVLEEGLRFLKEEYGIE